MPWPADGRRILRPFGVEGRGPTGLKGPGGGIGAVWAGSLGIDDRARQARVGDPAEEPRLVLAEPPSVAAG
jgi:hypothetical protein